MIAKIKALFIALMLGVAAAWPCTAQTAPEKTSPTPVTHSSAAAKEFQEHCAACHGQDGRGFGVITEKVQRPAADLTQIAKLNNGVFPAERVENTIRNGGDVDKHKSVLMPAWKKVYGIAANRKEADAILSDLTRYVESIQEK